MGAQMGPYLSEAACRFWLLQPVQPMQEPFKARAVRVGAQVRVQRLRWGDALLCWVTPVDDQSAIDLVARSGLVEDLLPLAQKGGIMIVRQFRHVARKLLWCPLSGKRKD